MRANVPHLFSELSLPTLPRPFWILSLAICACRVGGAELPVTEVEAESAETAMEQVDGESRSSPSLAEPVEVVAVTPGSLAAELDPSAANVLLDLAALRVWAEALPASSSGEERVVGLVTEAIVSQAKRVLQVGGRPEVEVDPLATMIGLSVGTDGLVVVSDAPISGPAGRLSRTVDGDFRLAFGAELGSGATHPPELPGDAFFTFWAPSPGAVPAPAASSVDFLTEAGVSSVGLGIRGDGSLVAHLTVEDPRAVSLALGRGQAFASQAVGQLNQSAPPEMQPWVTYANRVVQSLFAQISFSTDDTGALLDVAAPMCGGALHNLLSVAILLTTADAAAEDLQTEPREFVAMSGHPASSCDAQVSGPAPTIPLELLRVGSSDASEQSFVFIVDLGALLRRGLPRGFGLLPFALEPEMLSEIFSGRPMGLTGLDDPASHIVVSSERTAGSGAPAHRVILFPPGMRAFLPPDSGIDTMRPVPMARHVAFASPAVDLRTRLGSIEADHWTAGHEVLPADAYAVAFLGAGMVQPWADRLDRDDPARTWVSNASGGLVWLGDRGVGAMLYGVPDPPSADAIRAALPGLLGQITRGVQSAERREEREDVVRLAIDQLWIQTAGNTIELRLEGSPATVLAAALRIGIPLLGGESGRTVGLPQAFQVPR